MALTTFQKYFLTEQILYQNLKNLVESVDNVMRRAQNENELLLRISGPDLAGLSIPAETQTLLANVRTAITEMLAFYYGDSTTQTEILGELADDIRL